MAHYTMQEAFDIAWLHAHKLPHQSRGITRLNTLKTSSVCAYRSDEGLRCLVGALIKDDDYHQDLEGLSASELPTDIINIVGVDERKRGEFLDHLQSAHDRTREKHLWFDRLKAVAEHYGLKCPS